MNAQTMGVAISKVRLYSKMTCHNLHQTVNISSAASWSHHAFSRPTPTPRRNSLIPFILGWTCVIANMKIVIWNTGHFTILRQAQKKNMISWLYLLKLTLGENLLKLSPSSWLDHDSVEICRCLEKTGHLTMFLQAQSKKCIYDCWLLNSNEIVLTEFTATACHDPFLKL